MGQRLCLAAAPPTTPSYLEGGSPEGEPIEAEPAGKPDGIKSNLQTALKSVESLITGQEGKILILQKLMDAVEADVKKRREELKGAKEMPESRKDVLRATLRWHMTKQMDELKQHELLDKDVQAAVLKHIQSLWETLQSELLPVSGPPQPPSMSK